MHAVIVDPSTVVLKHITKLLAPHCDTVSEFIGASAALDKITHDPTVDTLIASLELQPMTGLELCREARLAVSAQRPLYIIVMSSLRDGGKLAEALDCGADELIAMPVDALELRARLRMAGRLKAAQLHLVRLAETDPLTGLYNRRAFFERLDARIRNRNRPIRFPPFSWISTTSSASMTPLAMRSGTSSSSGSPARRPRSPSLPGAWAGRNIASFSKAVLKTVH